jgi:hypothetical protein
MCSGRSVFGKKTTFGNGKRGAITVRYYQKETGPGHISAHLPGVFHDAAGVGAYPEDDCEIKLLRYDEPPCVMG